MNWLYKLYAWAIAYMVAVILALGAIAALGKYVAPLAGIVALLIVGRGVWWYTRW